MERRPRSDELHFFRHVFPYLKIGLDLAGFRQGDLLVGLFYLPVRDHYAVPPDFEVPLIGVDDDVKIVIGAKLALQSRPEYLLQDSHKRYPVNELVVLELGE